MSTDIRKARVEKGLSQDAAAALAGISGHRLARIERGGAADATEVDKILKALAKAKAGDSSRVGKGRPAGSVAVKKTAAPAKKTTTRKATTKKTASKRAAKKTVAADIL